jgi:uracil-DNA glycosylase
MKFREQLHPSWRKLLQADLTLLDEIEEKIALEKYLPKHSLVMRAFSYDFSAAKVLILGQDPYPSPIYPTGLAFSVPSDVVKIPSSLKNIFKELHSDLNISPSGSGDLSPWASQGVVLLNRTLTCRYGESNSHVELGWRVFTERCVALLADAGVIAILWGNSAQECSKYFAADKLITSPHPSPLAAHRGFFGSRPFSRTNAALIVEGKEAIDWSL